MFMYSIQCKLFNNKLNLIIIYDIYTINENGNTPSLGMVCNKILDSFLKDVVNRKAHKQNKR